MGRYVVQYGVGQDHADIVLWDGYEFLKEILYIVIDKANYGINDLDFVFF